MKKLMLLFVFIGFLMPLQAQQIMQKDIPDAVMTTFNKSHSYLKDVRWHRAGVNYEAMYEIDKMDKSLTYDTWGKLIETKLEIRVLSLPASILEYMKKNHPAHPIKRAYQMMDQNDTVIYETEITGMNLTFSAKGDFIKSAMK